MEVATADFVRGIRYLEAARRCETWSGDDLTEGKLRKLARCYRRRAATLLAGEMKVGAPIPATENGTPEVRRGVHAAPGGKDV